MRKFHLAIWLFFLTPLHLLAQQGSITGFVTDAMSGEALPWATVAIEGTGKGSVTDLEGQFEITGLQAGEYKLVVAFVGFASQSSTVTLAAGENARLDFQLAGDGLSLEDVIVTGVVNARSALESSVAMSTIKPGFIEEFGAVTTAELFKAIPGIRSEASGGEGNANIAVRGVPVASGGAKFLQIHEDGLPVLQFGDISFGNADIFMRADRTLARIEAIKGGSASTFASNSPAGIINLISETGAVQGGSVATSLGLDYNTFRTDFEYGSPIGEGTSFHIGGFFRQGEGPREIGYMGNYGGQIKANLTKNFDNGYARVYFKYLNDRAVSYLPMPVRVSGTGADPTFESVEGFDLTRHSLQSTDFLNVFTLDGDGNRRSANIADGMNPRSTAIGSELSFDLGDGWQMKNRSRMAFTSGSFNAPFPAQVAAADGIAESIAGAGYSLSYANGTDAGVPLTTQQIQNLNGNGLLMRIHTFDVEMSNLNNFTNDFYLTKNFGKIDLTAGYYKAYQRIAMTWMWQSYLTDVGGEGGPRLMDVATADGTSLSDNGLLAYGVPFWGNCCTRDYDVAYSIDAAYANLGAQITEQINLDASWRWDFGSASGFYLGNFQAPMDVNGDGALDTLEQQVTVLDNGNPNIVNYEFDYHSFSVGMNYKLSDNQAVYARYSQGGRANADRLLYSPFLTAEGRTIDGLDADRISQAELGYKHRAGRWSLITTAFFTQISEQNEEFGRILNKDFVTYGLEAELSANFGNFDLLAGATFTQATIQKSINPAEEGNVPRRVPALLYNISPSYRFLGNKAAVGFSLIGTSKVYAQDDNVVAIPGYLYANAFASYDLTRGLTLRLNSNNLTNTLGFTEMEGDAFVEGQDNFMRARPITGRATLLSVVYAF